jgi:hypothetical protein
MKGHLYIKNEGMHSVLQEFSSHCIKTIKLVGIALTPQLNVLAAHHLAKQTGGANLHSVAGGGGGGIHDI